MLQSECKSSLEDKLYCISSFLKMLKLHATQVLVGLSIDPRAQQFLTKLYSKSWCWLPCALNLDCCEWCLDNLAQLNLDMVEIAPLLLLNFEVHEVLTPKTWRPTWRWYTAQCLGWTNQWVQGYKNGFSTFVNSQLKGPSSPITKLDLLWNFFLILIVENMM